MECVITVTFLTVNLSNYATRHGPLRVIIAGSDRDRIRTSGKLNNFRTQVSLLSSLHHRGPGAVLLSTNSVFRNAPCFGLCKNQLRIRTCGVVNCGTVALKGRRFSGNVSSLIGHISRVGCPIIYTGCSFNAAPLTSLMGPCAVVRRYK